MHRKDIQRPKTRNHIYIHELTLLGKELNKLLHIYTIEDMQKGKTLI
jgi:hypothetical protein